MLLSRLQFDMLPPRAILLTADVILLSISEQASVEGRFFDGREPPYGTVAVQSASGAHRVAAMRQSEFHFLPESSLLSIKASSTQSQHQKHDLADPFNTIILGSDIAELADELDVPSQRRLLAFMLGFCRKAFSLAEDPDFASACLRLARLCTPVCGVAEPIATVTGSWTIVGGLPDLSDNSLLILDGVRVRRSAAPMLDGFTGLKLIERVTSNDVLLVQGAQAALYTVAVPRPNTPDLLLSKASDTTGLRAACLRVLAPLCPRIAAHLRETAFLSPATPRRHDDVTRPLGAGLEAALPDGEGRLFLRGWVRDPMNLVTAIDLVGAHKVAQLDPKDVHWFRRSDIDKHFAGAAFSNPNSRTGFVAFMPDPCNGYSLHPSISLRLHSGARVEVRPPLKRPLPAAARTAVLASVPPEDVTDTMLDNCLGPAAASFHRRSLAARGAPELIRIGALPANPTVSIIIPLYRNLSFLRFQLAAFARDPECRAAELIFVLDSPEQAREVEHLLRGLYALHDLALTLIVLPHNLGYAAANNAGAAVAQAPALLLLNSDVVPAAPGWLGALTVALAQDGVGAVGPKLLFDDNSIQHAGLFFQRDLDGQWLNAHYYKGMPRLWPGAATPRRVPGVTGAALLVHRHLFEAVGGICEDYIVGDYEDSDFCLRLHALGARTGYVPVSELFHFERRSISLHKGYSGTLACRYNRRLHHRRWDGSIAALMTEPEFRMGGEAP